MPDLYKIQKTYGNDFHLRPPPGSFRSLSAEQTTIITEVTPAATLLLCQIKVAVRSVVVLHTYGVVAAQLVPSTDFVGFEYEPLNPLALGGRIRWSVLAGDSSAVNGIVVREDGGRHEGYSTLSFKEVGAGAQPLVFVSTKLINLVIQIIDPTQGANISPNHARLAGLLEGYSLPIPLQPNPGN